jgi:hypothetical protein
MRVTVIATGLDDERLRRRHDRGRQLEEAANVRPLRPEPTPIGDRLPAAQRQVESPQATREDPSPAERYETEVGQDEWVSPFEDELDVPTFLRRETRREGDEDRDEPAFLRRSAD